MLVLSRKRNEKIRIGKHIKITVVEILGDRVRLGIEAPPATEIIREELVLTWHRDPLPRKATNVAQRPGTN